MSLSGDQIVAALDDIAGAIDGFSKRFDSLDQEIMLLHERLAAIENKETDAELRMQERLGDIESTLDALPKDVANFLEEHSVLGDARELIETLDRKERQEMLQDARSGKHVVGFAF